MCLFVWESVLFWYAIKVKDKFKLYSTSTSKWVLKWLSSEQMRIISMKIVCLVHNRKVQNIYLFVFSVRAYMHVNVHWTHFQNKYLNRQKYLFNPWNNKRTFRIYHMNKINHMKRKRYISPRKSKHSFGWRM